MLSEEDTRYLWSFLLKPTKKTRYLFLFNDLMLVAKLKKTKDGTKYKTKEVISLEKASLHIPGMDGTSNCVENLGEANVFQLLTHNTTFTFIVENKTNFDQWITEVKSAINLVLEARKEE